MADVLTSAERKYYNARRTDKSYSVEEKRRMFVILDRVISLFVSDPRTNFERDEYERLRKDARYDAKEKAWLFVLGDRLITLAAAPAPVDEDPATWVPSGHGPSRIEPSSATVKQGQSVTFRHLAWPAGGGDEREFPAEWSATAGSIDSNGRYVAHMAGTFTVMARSKEPGATWRTAEANIVSTPLDSYTETPVVTAGGGGGGAAPSPEDPDVEILVDSRDSGNCPLNDCADKAAWLAYVRAATASATDFTADSVNADGRIVTDYNGAGQHAFRTDQYFLGDANDANYTHLIYLVSNGQVPSAPNNLYVRSGWYHGKTTSGGGLGAVGHFTHYNPRNGAGGGRKKLLINRPWYDIVGVVAVTGFTHTTTQTKSNLGTFTREGGGSWATNDPGIIGSGALSAHRGMYVSTGANAGLNRGVTGYNATTGILIHEAFPVPLADGDVFGLSDGGGGSRIDYDYHGTGLVDFSNFAASSPYYGTDGMYAGGNRGQNVGSWAPADFYGVRYTELVHFAAESSTGASDGVLGVWHNGVIDTYHTGLPIGVQLAHRLGFPDTRNSPESDMTEYWDEMIIWKKAA